ncbi:MAG: aminotransferase class I/II-fold pyridoxal phosphate-dependent enzyme [Chitinivibrionales bacterium]|nr:aminotransferase class I/II-fold pyridoxal phosphate-dependent enzyme [Chitinivibrionales bacterium]
MSSTSSRPILFRRMKSTICFISPKSPCMKLYMRQTPLSDRLARERCARKASALFRQTAPCEEVSIDLSTNSYLSLHDNTHVHAAAHKLIDGQLSGNLASRIISTGTALYARLESALAQWKQTETALVFNSGYAANVGMIQALANRSTDIFCDRLNHASIYDGIRLCGARLHRYRHCDVNDLRKRVQTSSSPEKIIVTDSVFSMDGDCAPLADICDVARAHDALVMVDEAHATGIFGMRHSGWVEACGVEEAIDIRMGTLSKAVAGLGGFFSGSFLLRDHFVNHARSLIYSTALPHSVLAFDLAAIDYIRSHVGIQAKLLAKAQHFRQLLTDAGFDTLNSTTQIIPCLIGDDARTLHLSRHLRKHGIKAPAVRPPTVPKGTSRLRFSIHANVDEEHLRRVVSILKSEIAGQSPKCSR